MYKFSKTLKFYIHFKNNIIPILLLLPSINWRPQDWPPSEKGGTLPIHDLWTWTRTLDVPLSPSLLVRTKGSDMYFHNHVRKFLIFNISKYKRMPYCCVLLRRLFIKLRKEKESSRVFVYCQKAHKHLLFLAHCKNRLSWVFHIDSGRVAKDTCQFLLCASPGCKKAHLTRT